MSVGHHHHYSHSHQPNHSHHGGGSPVHGIRDASSYEVWKNFFASAGIPDTVAHGYALTFSNHRVKIDMLKEITKDILLDMGIKAMGDIIAILRHAKDLCTQDELKSACGPTNTTTNQTSARPNLAPQATPTQPATRSTNTLAQRMPISTKSGLSITKQIGNKIQSRLNLDSGALTASSTNSTTNNNNNNNNHSFSSQQLNKRPSSTMSSSLAKRLRPGPGDSARLQPRELAEKTLTVHYPSGDAIARAQQRISGSMAPIATHTTASINNPSSIRLRLGSTADTPNKDNHQRGVNKNSGNSNSKLSFIATNNRISTSKRSNSRDRSKRDTEPDRRQQSTRPKSTVFSRLGETFG